eukprot:4609742-Alexandrium_andersonii.AAC.1
MARLRLARSISQSISISHRVEDQGGRRVGVGRRREVERLDRGVRGVHNGHRAGEGRADAHGCHGCHGCVLRRCAGKVAQGGAVQS